MLRVGNLRLSLAMRSKFIWSPQACSSGSHSVNTEKYLNLVEMHFSCNKVVSKTQTQSTMSQILNLFLLSMILTGANAFFSSTSTQVTGRCTGRAINYLISIPNLQDCLEACDNDERCCYFSHHKSDDRHPYHNHCLLFSAGHCDLEDLIYSGAQSHWFSGSRTLASSRCPRLGTHMTLLRNGSS